ncbi:hypothetical protein Q5P01_006169 [Channa striata]|uniref:Sema domain-containing protein n=1 Tax=Channa striata TaxID=64152 RepID=A0AA88NGZ1_CHASR|nr:hypothetical protein Q5P01_006169 [Channa striata]
MVFTDKETTVTKISLTGDHAAVPILLADQLETVIAAGQKSLNSYNFQNPTKQTVDRMVQGTCGYNDQTCNYNITMVNKRTEANQVFVCGTSGTQTLCCNMNLSDTDPMCKSSEKTKGIEDRISGFIVKEGDPYVLVESAVSANLYVAYSGIQDFVGIHKFGKDKVGPSNHDKEQHYVAVFPIMDPNDPVQDKLYAFYREKNQDTDMYNEMWIPFVTSVCMVDTGGRKNALQYSWTSQMNARLFCGYPDNKQSFSELVDVATVHGDRWQDTRFYGLFRNKWGMSAVCVYTMQDISNIFATSPFIKENGRPRECNSNSKLITLEILQKIEMTSEMEQWVRPENNTAPLLFSHHHYTHIYVDHKKNDDHTVLFLSLNNGRIHKVMQSGTQTLVISEYRPFDQHTNIFSMVLHPASRKLYLKSRSELVQMDVSNCGQYGDNCEDCILARDPYCGWNGTQCVPVNQGKLQDVTGGNYNICASEPRKEFRYSFGTSRDVNIARLPAQAKYFLRCPVSSHHAEYTWNHDKSSMPCSTNEQQCIFLIDSMGSNEKGTYKCVSEEMGYKKVVAQYNLELENRATVQLSSSLIWVCLVAVMIKSLSY